jgi:hypothetical protein
MADRTSAELFGEIFKLLAGDGPLDRTALARHFWEKSQGYDFCHYQMYCTEALMRLGLARRGIDPRHPEDGEVMLYGPAK